VSQLRILLEAVLPLRTYTIDDLISLVADIQKKITGLTSLIEK
jgi:hypothetical protein